MNRIVACLLVALPLFAAAPAAQAKSRTWTLTVTNKTCSPIAISVDGRFQEAIPSSTFHTVKGLKPGLHTVTVKGCSGGVDREIRVDGVQGNAYEEFVCAHVTGAPPQDPYRQGAQPTGVPPAPVIVPYQPVVKVVEVERRRPSVEIITDWHWPRHRCDHRCRQGCTHVRVRHR